LINRDAHGSSAGVVNFFMTVRANCDQIRFVVIPELTPELQVVNFEILHRTASLASPAISLENASMQLAVGLG